MDNSADLRALFATPVTGSGQKLPSAPAHNAPNRATDRARDQILDKGFRAYIEELPHAKRQEEARQKVLMDMNLTERDLNRLQRALPNTQYNALIDQIENRTQHILRQSSSQAPETEPLNVADGATLMQAQLA